MTDILIALGFVGAAFLICFGVVFVTDFKERQDVLMKERKVRERCPACGMPGGTLLVDLSISSYSGDWKKLCPAHFSLAEKIVKLERVLLDGKDH